METYIIPYRSGPDTFYFPFATREAADRFRRAMGID